MKIEIEIEKEDAVIFVSGLINKDVSSLSEDELIKTTIETIENSIEQTVIGIKVKAFENQLIKERNKLKESKR